MEGFDADNVNEVESMCPSCHKNGLTRMLMVKVPYFKEVIVVSFDCPHCNEHNTSVQPAATIAATGSNFLLKVTCKQDLQRRIVKSDAALFQILEVEFEIPANVQPGQFTTLEGIIMQAITNLEMLQPDRKTHAPEQYEAINAFLEKMRGLLTDEPNFTVILDDPTGNSFIENPHAPSKDPNLTHTPYARSDDQNLALGLNLAQERAMAPGNKAAAIMNNDAAENLAEKFTTAGDIMELPSICPSCQTNGVNRMCITSIPHFKEVIIMAFKCDHCGFKSTEVKCGGEIADHGTRYILNVADELDLNRDVLKSDTASAKIIENGEVLVGVETGTLGGMFTTVEGFLNQVRTQLDGVMPFSAGDSADAAERTKMLQVVATLGEFISGRPFTLVIDDPVSNSYVQDIYVPDPDPQMTVETYTRSTEQDDELGLLDMRV
ncbi:ZPR1 zinc-finger domain [Carpediemonas membranifera]|uniref:ZPR1 zinc-finger domain n=1 Tax=Carpediemonas membranifera TaxID=201153 RepID=A0A8J6E6H5_9EUKA|nr:ZPR1 zinc-finger domain [Carpediemonas membranifera]|eukprot:KAG9397117.1 ZPR1 zinc-finger domain [Carpediemonas membranifera]